LQNEKDVFTLEGKEAREWLRAADLEGSLEWISKYIDDYTHRAAIFDVVAGEEPYTLSLREKYQDYVGYLNSDSYNYSQIFQRVEGEVRKHFLLLVELDTKDYSLQGRLPSTFECHGDKCRISDSTRHCISCGSEQDDAYYLSTPTSITTCVWKT
jgi:hypothetical protein